MTAWALGLVLAMLATDADAPAAASAHADCIFARHFGERARATEVVPDTADAFPGPPYAGDPVSAWVERHPLRWPDRITVGTLQARLERSVAEASGDARAQRLRNHLLDGDRVASRFLEALVAEGDRACPELAMETAPFTSWDDFLARYQSLRDDWRDHEGGRDQFDEPGLRYISHSRPHVFAGGELAIVGVVEISVSVLDDRIGGLATTKSFRIYDMTGETPREIRYIPAP